MPALLTRLDGETRRYHGETDAVWRDLLAPDVTLAQYMHVLARVYGFEAPIEAAVAYTPGIDDLGGGRCRSGLIAADLLALQVAPSQLAAMPQCPTTPFAGAAEALGWLYVLERSRLLHDTVRRHLIHRLPQTQWATSYLETFDSARPTRWNELARSIDRVATSLLVEAHVIDAARDAFRCAIEWFHGRELPYAHGA